MLSTYGKREWLTIAVIGVLFTATLLSVGLWPWALLTLLATAAVLTFFRDPERRIPSQRGVVVSPADGRISSIHHLDHFDPLDEGATCVRVFLSVLDVHVNRSPCHSIVHSITHKPGQHLNVLNPQSAEVNESNLIVLLHPVRKHKLAAVRQVAGLLARTIVCGVKEGQILQRGQRLGMIKLGSTTELYLPDSLQPQIAVQQGQRVKGGLSVVATVQPVLGTKENGEVQDQRQEPASAARSAAASDAAIE